MKRAKGFLAMIFVILSLLLTACSNRPEPSSRAANANTAANANIAVNANSTSPPPLPSPKVNPERLIDIISQLQVEYVRESFGLQSGQCFTDVDFKKFMHEKTPDKIVEGLRSDQDFIAVVNAIRDMNSERRSALLDRARGHYKRTWAELGLDPRTTSANELRRGQTDAGQQAEKLIAEAVVDLVRQMI
jgi:hypothetical protein